MLVTKKHISLFSIIISLLILITSCTEAYEFNGDLLQEVKEASQTYVNFQKDEDSPVAFSVAYNIGEDISAGDLPGADDERVRKLKPGYIVSGWKYSIKNNGDVTNSVKADANGYIISFHMTPIELYLYAGDFIPAKDTPYKIVYKIQNKTLDGYDVYKTVTKKGTTSTAEAASYTQAAGNLIDIKGFSPRLDLISEVEIQADGSSIVEVLYDRNIHILTLHDNIETAVVEETVTQNFYYDVPQEIILNTFARTGYGFEGWATSRTRAAEGKVDYSDGSMYTIGNKAADLYAVWKLPEITISIELPSADEVGIRYELTTETLITFYAVIPEGHDTSEYTFNWLRKGQAIASIPSDQKYSSWGVDTAGWAAGTYEITLIAVHTSDGMPSGGTVQIVITQ